MSVRPSEKEEERLCNIERYADVDSEEEMLWDYSEDERIAYVDDKRERRQIEAEEKIWKEALEASRPKPDFKLHISVPEEMITPLTKRQFAIIEKTATFLNQSPATPNMEIVIQTKQSGNPDFSFLNTSDDLYPFYRHIRELMKAGEYVQLKEKPEPKMEESEIPQQNPSVTSQKPTVYSGPIPSSETKVIIDKTASFVARAGPALEGRLRERNASNPRFNFLNPWNEFHAYWKSALKKASTEEHEKQTTGDNSEEQVPPSTPIPSATDPGESSSPCETRKPTPPLSSPTTTNLDTSSTEAMPSVLQDEATPSVKTLPMTISTDKDSQARRRRRAEDFLAKRRREAVSTTEVVSENGVPRTCDTGQRLDTSIDETEVAKSVLRARAAPGAESAQRNEKNKSAESEIDSVHMTDFAPCDQPSEMKTALQNASTVRHEKIPAKQAKPSTEFFPDSDHSSSSSLSRIGSNRKRPYSDVSGEDSDDSERFRRHHHKSSRGEPKDRRKHYRRRSRSKSKSPSEKRRFRNDGRWNDGRSVATSDYETTPERKRRKNRSKRSSNRRRVRCGEGSEGRRGRDQESGRSRGHSGHRREGSMPEDKKASKSSEYRIHREREEREGSFGNKQR